MRSLLAAVTSEYGQKIEEAMGSGNRPARQAILDQVKVEAKGKYKETYAEFEIDSAIEEISKKICRSQSAAHQQAC